MIKLNPVLVSQITVPNSIRRVAGILEAAMETSLVFCFLLQAPTYFRITYSF